MNYFWVNIAETYKEVVESKLLWAPIPYLHENKKLASSAGCVPLEQAKVGDIFFCKKGAIIEYVAIATNNAYEDQKPDSSSFNKLKLLGNRVDVYLHQLRTPLDTSMYGEIINGTFYEECTSKVVNRLHNVCDINSSSLSKDAGHYLMNLLGDDKAQVLKAAKGINEYSYLGYSIPYKSHSWEIVSFSSICKTVDKTLIAEQSSGVPIDIVSFIHPTPLENGEKISIDCFVENRKFDIDLLRKVDGRYKLNFQSVKEILKLKKLKEGDFLWLERREENSKAFDIYTDAESAKHSVIPKEPKNGTSRESVTTSRRGQDYFKSQVNKVCKGQCVVTGVKDQTPSILIGSHIKAWSLCSDKERMDGENGLLLAPHVDKLFDSYLISFSETGEIIVSNRLDKSVVATWGIDLNKKYELTPKQLRYMDEHRKVFEAKQK